MRVPVILLTLFLAGPAMAQAYLPLQQSRDAEAFAAAEAARARDIAVSNDLAAMQARLQTEQAVSNIAAARAAAPAPPPLRGATRPGAPAPVIDATKLVSIPDAALAQSNARVLAAANNRK
jgi:hypothetical protein